MPKFTLTSTDFTEGDTLANTQVFNEFGCKGGNVSPALAWSGAPAGTQSFALLMHDPDAPTGSGWWHWVVYNIPAATGSLPAGAGDAKKGLMPKGAVQGRTDYGSVGYGGPCPPPGKPHHYHFRLFALDAMVNIPGDVTRDKLMSAIQPHILAQGEIVGLYQR